MTKFFLISKVGIFKNIEVIILISVIAIIFLYKIDDLSNKTEKIAIKAMVNEINAALSLVVF